MAPITFWSVDPAVMRRFTQVGLKFMSLLNLIGMSYVHEILGQYSASYNLDIIQ